MRDLENDARFAELLDECSERVRRGEPLAACLGDYPSEYREELARLVPVGTRVSTLARDPSPRFQAELEARLLSSDFETAGRPHRGVLSRIADLIPAAGIARVVAIAAAVLLVLVAGGFGVDRASAGSLPDSPLYQVKAAREQVQLALAGAPEAQVDVHAKQIAQRGTELDQAVKDGKTPKVVDTLIVRVESSVEKMVNQALDARSRGNLVPARRAFVAIRAAQRRLDQIIPRSQGNVRPALQQLWDFLEQQEHRLVPPFSTSPIQGSGLG